MNSLVVTPSLQFRNTLLSTSPKYVVGIYKCYQNTCLQCSVGAVVNKSLYHLYKDVVMCKGKRVYTILTFVLLFQIVLLVALLCALTAINVGTAGTVSHDKPVKSPSTANGVKAAIMIADVVEELSCDMHFGSNDTGIRFRVVVNSTYYTLIVTSIGTGMDIINVMHPQSSNMTMTSIYNVTFMIMMNSTSQVMNDYIVPANATGLMETMMRSNNPQMTNALFQELDSSNVDIVRRLSLQLLASSKEAYLIIEAAKGFVQLTDFDSMRNPKHMKQFCLLGLELEKMRSQLYLLGEPSTTFKHRKCTTRRSYCPAGTKSKCYDNCYDDCSCEEKGFFTWACFRAGCDSFHNNCQFFQFQSKKHVI